MNQQKKEYNDNHRLKEKSKDIIGIIVVILLFSFVIFAIISQNHYTNSNENLNLEKKQINETFIKTGETKWKLINTDTFPSVDEQGRIWYESGYQPEEWQEISGSFSEDNEILPVYYFLTEFEIEDAKQLSQLSGKIAYDDAVIIYCNGVQIYSVNVPDEGFDQEGYGAKKVVDDYKIASFTIDDVSFIQDGKNYLAVELHQSSANSSDIFFEFTYLKGIISEFNGDMINTSGLIMQPGNNENSRMINWMTDISGDYQVQYCKESTWFKNYKSIDMIETEMEDRYIYNVNLSGLEPGEKYVYRIYEKGEDIYSDEYRFQIPGKRKGVNFLFVGDPQIGEGDDLDTDLNSWIKTLEIAENTTSDIAFIISAGDQNDSSEIEDAIEEYEVFRYPDQLKEIPIAVTRGNHDTVEDLYTKQFMKMDNSKEDDYYYMYNEVLFVNLDSIDTYYDEHIDFLKNAIAECNPKWTIVTMHYSIFSTSGHAEEEKILKAREAYAEAFSDCGVDVVLSGHDHMYARSYLMNGMESTGKESGKKFNGEVLYLVGTSSTGNKFYDNNVTEQDYIAFYDKEPNKVPLYTYISIQNNTLTLKTIRVSDLKVYDECYIIK